MGSIKNTDKKTRKFISIPDMEKWELIDKLAELPKYEKSFNKIINDALDYGLPMLVKAEFGEVEKENRYVPEEPLYENEPKKELDMYYRLDEFMEEIVGLMEEIILNVTINKSLLCSLFNEKVYELNRMSLLGKTFGNGDFRDTPEYLEAYEKRAIREINNRRKKTE